LLQIIDRGDVLMIEGTPHTLPTSTIPRITSGSLDHTIRLKVNRLVSAGAGIDKVDCV
jgi:hypothetical protein